jgi:sulfatase maturation enzyme AslB (radical SAM superfamily)
MYQYAELVHWMQNKDTMKILPAQVDIDLTNVCNQDCFYCNSAEFRAREPVQKKYTEYIALLDKLSAWRSHSPKSYGTTHTITYPGGGEPTVLIGYENVIEHTIDLGFLTSITTNGSNLDKLLQSVAIEKLKKMAWVGIDIDAGTEEVYEKIRRSLTRESLFSKVVENATEMVKAGVNVDIKILLNEFNDSYKDIRDIFILSKKIGARMVFFRPAIIDNIAYQITPELQQTIKELSEEFAIEGRVNMGKYMARNYKKCHQMFQFPIFTATGKIYICCENKGNPNFELCAWDTGDFRDLWLSPRHMEIYEKTRVEFCQPCRPNVNNIRIQDILNKPETIETLYQ